MVSRSKRHKNAHIRAARQRKRERERMKAWHERQEKWKRKDRIFFYLQLIGMIATLILLVYILSGAFKQIF
jgi:hypothetical protein